MGFFLYDQWAEDPRFLRVISYYIEKYAKDNEINYRDKPMKFSKLLRELRKRESPEFQEQIAIQ